MKATAQIFLSYAREDRKRVEKLYQELSKAGFKPWMDKRDILPGEKWELAIQKAIQRSDFFLVCLSKNSVGKRGWIQREIREALHVLKGMLDSDIYLIQVRLEDCEAPESLASFQWVNLFEANGWTRLVKAIQVGMERRAEGSIEVVEEEKLEALIEILEREEEEPDLESLIEIFEEEGEEPGLESLIEIVEETT